MNVDAMTSAANVAPDNVFTGESLSNGSASQQQQQQQQQDWFTSFEGIGAQKFSERAIDILMAPVADADIEVKPGIIISIVVVVEDEDVMIHGT
jgi:hypothetical protein